MGVESARLDGGFVPSRCGLDEGLSIVVEVRQITAEIRQQEMMESRERKRSSDFYGLLDSYIGFLGAEYSTITI
jgi:hypothetical protein